MTDVLNMTTEMDEREVARASLEAAEEQLQSLCASHAGTFVSVERRGREIQLTLEQLQASVKAVEALVETSQATLDRDQEESEDRNLVSREGESSLEVLSDRHRVRRRTLLQHTSLLELLELPSLMDACVRSNLYDEALSIATFANTLERRHQQQKHEASSSSNPVVARVISQIRWRQADLQHQLLHRLKSSVTMPQCLEVVTALRRLNAIELERVQSKNQSLEEVHASMELRLQVGFLEARDVWLDDTRHTDGGNSSLVGAATSEKLLDVIERYRTRYVSDLSMELMKY